MFCSQCGKEVLGNIPLCEDCQNKQNDTFYAEPEKVYDTRSTDGQEETIHIVEPQCESEYEEQSKKASRMLGFPGARASAIIGYFADMIVGAVFYALLDFLLVIMMTPEMFGKVPLAGGIIAVILGIPLVFVPLALGLKSISTYRKATDKKPIPTLALGIAGTVLSVFALLAWIGIDIVTILLFVATL